MSMAQDTTEQLRGVDILVKKYEQNTALVSKEVLKADPNKSFAELLQLQSGIFIRSQGYGALNTLSYKGLSTNNIPVLINGFNIQSRMNGAMDLSLLSAFHYSSAAFTELQTNSTVPSNLMEGIELSSDKGKAPQAFISAESIHAYSAGLSVGKQKANTIHRLSLSGKYAINDYSLTRYGEDRRLEHSQFKNGSALYSLNKYADKWSWDATAYVQIAQRMIPPALNASEDGEQGDVNLMLGNRFDFKLAKNTALQISQQINRESITYQSESRELNVQSKATSTSHNLNLQHEFSKKWKLNTGVLHQYIHYSSESLLRNVDDNRIRLHFGSSYQLKHSFLSGNIHSNPLYRIAGFDLKWSRGLWKNHLIIARLGKHYRLPVLNELYWFEPGSAYGDQDLKAESGYRAELDYIFQKKNWRIKFNPFIGRYTNMISWAGYPVIRAVNLQAVNVEGLILGIQYNRKFNKHQINIQQKNNLTLSTYNEENDPLERNGNQLIYTPVYTANLMLNHQYKNCGSFINTVFVSENYYTSDNTAWLDPYFLVDAGGYYQSKNWRFGISLNNILNAAYFTVLNRPLPGRRISISLTYQFKSKEKQ